MGRFRGMMETSSAADLLPRVDQALLEIYDASRPASGSQPDAEAPIAQCSLFHRGTPRQPRKYYCANVESHAAGPKRCNPHHISQSNHGQSDANQFSSSELHGYPLSSSVTHSVAKAFPVSSSSTSSRLPHSTADSSLLAHTITMPGQLKTLIGTIRRRPSPAPDGKSYQEATIAPTLKRTSLCHELIHL